MEQRPAGLTDTLNPKSAMLVGLVGGVLVLCTVGFLIMLGLLIGGKLELANGSSLTPSVYAVAPEGTPGTPTLPPPPSVPKSDRPKVELFVMSYCPYGLQMQKGYIEAWDLLKKRADIDIKFVSYAMHEKQEVDENTLQYCIQKEQNSKYLAYLQCFTASGNTASCLSSTNIDTKKTTRCVDAANKDFGILNEYNDKSRWLSGQFPQYPIHADLNTQYAVQGSPTLVINGAQVSVGRSPEEIKQAICAAFNEAPGECDTPLNPNAYVAGFGTGLATANAAAGAAGCGT